MPKTNKLISKYYRTRSYYYRINRILFPSPAELKFVDIMGGKSFAIDFIKHPKTKFPLAFVWSLGKHLNDENFKREVRVGKYYIDFGNDIGIGLEIDGHHWHRDVVAEFDRDSYLYQRNWRVIHIPAVRLYNEPGKVQSEVLSFLFK